MPSNGNMKPDSRIDGSMRHERELERLELRAASRVEITSPSVSVAAMKSPAASIQVEQACR